MYSLGYIAQYIGGELPVKFHDIEVLGISSLTNPKGDHISFIADDKYLALLEGSGISAVIARQEVGDLPCIIHPDPYLAYAKLTKLYSPIQPEAKVCASSSSSIKSKIPSSSSIGSNVSVGENVVLGERVVIQSGSVIGQGVEIGDDTIIGHNVTLCHQVKVGKNAIIHSGAVIGSDGFGFARDPNGWVKIHQLGSVQIGDCVEIGANSCIDRGALDDTVIEKGVIIDNLVQIAHNVKIGEYTAIAACCAIAGSARIGANCTIAGAVKIVGHIDIAAGSHIAADTLVSHTIRSAGVFSGSLPMDIVNRWRKNAVRFKQLDSLFKRVSVLEKKTKANEE